MNLRCHCFYCSYEKISGNGYRAKCVYCGHVLDGKPDKLEFHILHRCTLASVSRVEYIRIVERLFKGRHILAHISIRSQLGFES